MSTTDHHDLVARAYARALERAEAGTGSCCGPASSQQSTCCGSTQPVAVAATVAGYGDETARFQKAAATSFGCGNPLAFAGVRRGQRVLDLGSGAGFDLLIAAEAVGPEGRVIGVDMTDAMIDAARRNVEEAGFGNIEIRKGLIENLPVETGSMDWVVSNCVINLAPDKAAVFAEIARVLAPGGQFSVSDIVAEDLPAWVIENAAAYAACVAGAISEEEYVAGLRAAGLEDIRITERLVYDVDQVRAMVGSDLENLAVDPHLLDASLAGVQGKVASIKVTGRKPGSSTRTV